MTHATFSNDEPLFQEAECDPEVEAAGQLQLQPPPGQDGEARGQGRGVEAVAAAQDRHRGRHGQEAGLGEVRLGPGQDWTWSWTIQAVLCYSTWGRTLSYYYPFKPVRYRDGSISFLLLNWLHLQDLYDRDLNMICVSMSVIGQKGINQKFIIDKIHICNFYRRNPWTIMKIFMVPHLNIFIYSAGDK